MKQLQVEQGSSEWLLARLGIPTASDFHRIITPVRMGPVSEVASSKFICELIDQRLAHLKHGDDIEAIERELDSDMKTESMVYGNAMEPIAVTRYEFHRRIDTTLAGIIFNDDRTAGASLDRLVGDDGCCEIKCPIKRRIYLERALYPRATEFRPQIQGQLWLSGRKWIDACCYFRGQPLLIERHERDEKFIANLAGLHAEFSERLEQKWKEFLNRYPSE